MRNLKIVRRAWHSAERSTTSAPSSHQQRRGRLPNSLACSRLRNRAVSPSVSTSRRHAMKKTGRLTSQREPRLTQMPTDPQDPSYESTLPHTHQEPAVYEHHTTNRP